jgi:predicted nuclease with TOPRIM domain
MKNEEKERLKINTEANMDYLNNLHRIEKELSALDNNACGTVEEANNCLAEYDRLKNEIILIIEDFGVASIIKENVYKEAIRILTNYIGSADDIQKYGNILKSFHTEGKLSEQQLHFFYDNLDTGRWK